jgi:hypothetical protein
MRRHRIAPAALIVGLALGLAACGSDDAADDAATPATTAPATTAPDPPPRPAPRPPPTTPDPAPRPLPGLPADTAGFDERTRLNADPIPPDSAQTQRVGFDAHRGVKDVYVNQPRSAIAGSSPYPDGTIVVKAAGEGGSGDPTLIAIMRKVAGSDPAHGDWQFVEYKRGGTGDAFATDASLRDATCWSCHAIAMDADWVFTTPDPR